jgi:hypothetical protein
MALNLLTLALFGILVTFATATHKCVWVTGVLKCNKDAKNHMNVEVRAYDKDGIGILQALDPDDMMGVTFTETDGSFKLDGCGDDFNWLPGVPNLPDPYITIKHYCNSEKGETMRLPEFDVFVPDTYDIGILVLDEQSTEKTSNLPGDRDSNRSINTRFRPKLDETQAKEKEVVTSHEVLTKPDELTDDH